MKPNLSIKYLRRKQFTLLFLTTLIFFLINFKSQAQITAFTLQNISFGAFSPGSSGGTVVISSDGTRAVTGDVIAINLGFQYFPAIFEIEAPQGSIINILNGPDTQLTGSNGGTMTLKTGNMNPAIPFVSNKIPPQRSLITVGAILTVGGLATNPPGSYSGTLSITFVQE